MTTQELAFQCIDDALAKYYKRLNHFNYITNDGYGKFLKYAINEEFIDPDIPIETELGITCNPKDCVYIGFVDCNEFPIANDIIIPNNSKSVYVFYILQHCWLHGSPPSNEHIQNILISKVLGHAYSTIIAVGVHMADQLLSTQVRMHQHVMFEIAAGFAVIWLCVTALHLDYYIGIWLSIEDEYVTEENIIELEEG
eukprot:1003144_1